ncbi:MAG: Franean1_4349 family RiPP [Candidatus Binatia bacterium]
MSQKTVECLLGRLVTDRAFRQRFFQEPAATCAQESLDILPRELAALRAIEERAIERLTGELDPKIVRAALDLPVRRAGTARPKPGSARASGAK